MSGLAPQSTRRLRAHRIGGRTLFSVKDRERLITWGTVSIAAATLAILLATVFGTRSGTAAFFLVWIFSAVAIAAFAGLFWPWCRGALSWLRSRLLGQLLPRRLRRRGGRGSLARHGPVTPAAGKSPAAEMQAAAALSIASGAGEQSGSGAARPRPRVPQLAYIQRKTSGFVGRDSAFADLAAFLDAHPSGHVVVEGLPGAGKTSLLAEEVRRHSWPAHFNIAAGGVNSPLTFLHSLRGQLAERYGVRVAPPSAGDDVDGRYLSGLLEETADRLSAGEKLVIVVDALDEVSVAQTGANALFLPTALPAGLYLLVSRRSRTAPLQVDGPSVVVDLMARQAESRKDVEQFIRNSLARPEMAARLGGVADQEPVVASLLDRSELNFMYLVYVLGDIEAGRIRPDDLRGLPRGLSGYYERHLERMLAKEADAVLSLQTIYALATIREPVPASLLAGVVRVTELEVTILLADWAQFLLIGSDGGASTYGLYHQSFCDFLMKNDTVRAAGVDLGEISSTVGRGLMDRLGLDLDD